MIVHQSSARTKSWGITNVIPALKPKYKVIYITHVQINGIRRVSSKGDFSTSSTRNSSHHNGCQRYRWWDAVQFGFGSAQLQVRSDAWHSITDFNHFATHYLMLSVYTTVDMHSCIGVLYQRDVYELFRARRVQSEFYELIFIRSVVTDSFNALSLNIHSLRWEAFLLDALPLCCCRVSISKLHVTPVKSGLLRPGG